MAAASLLLAIRLVAALVPARWALTGNLGRILRAEWRYSSFAGVVAGRPG